MAAEVYPFQGLFRFDLGEETLLVERYATRQGDIFPVNVVPAGPVLVKLQGASAGPQAEIWFSDELASLVRTPWLGWAGPKVTIQGTDDSGTLSQVVSPLGRYAFIHPLVGLAGTLEALGTVARGPSRMALVSDIAQPKIS
jgi:hypothetical protein